jgi:hypothetical protein
VGDRADIERCADKPPAVKAEKLKKVPPPASAFARPAKMEEPNIKAMWK